MKVCAFGFDGKSLEETSAKFMQPKKWMGFCLEGGSVIGIAFGYCLSGSLLSIINKWAIVNFPFPGETLFLKQPWPLVRTWASLAVIFGGSVVYVLADSQLTLKAYSWAFAYLVSMTVDFVYIKHVVSTIQLSTWGLVLYNNLEALMLFPLELVLVREGWQLIQEVHRHTVSHWYSTNIWLPVGLSCMFGLSISFFGFACRKAISATSFTVLGVVNKLLTVLINLAVWSKHASALGTSGLLVCILGGILYQQSVEKSKAESSADSITDEESCHCTSDELELLTTKVENSVKEAENGLSMTEN
ncbi:hypothetical protein O6H91_12G080300 [Diphasiastrum complanatum]|uniref:Uncharacterized protein n=1 Tax=Diphasiastrum complanatum TaxID=34168 RepID=A0ACC2C475_DIPCM|nr:hypothetical protein O6H91_12G080300 [Diphasiastrum complanatum]